MSLTFPNRSRSYDVAGQRIRFVGHDGMLQISFSVAADAMTRMQPDTTADEAGYLAAFDRSSSTIHDVAAKAYSRTHKSLYVLTSDDFR
ncbi:MULTISPECIES: DUF1488 domain-containing protein [unclassified Mesorhizobium]|uniref:DUF1488 domain-containing protein n=1 Tax=unclassified Mesorhizobium TaxID=325217 RepID=UPI000FCBE59A|nr:MULTISPECIES: DUF1488 domain-containing protein [unclassified Mesorhizobium]RUX06845.1 DUF1488 domain-containing protein [Mesorhizobium sp. M8A.F.Ca.ET.023.01.1.1]RVD53979.1 DUF1488 domain-containing protein [Mesorhizobium sp. M8A.F.Ca.ET.023.02.2.1]TGR47362.1 DUF1488 domain-containing protein [bacterium M00.F.Ca.ET.199.01.1.1]TGU36815.1 DUF1488 domain-containing protein [bacterium M00.F.Ca.ET.156.01.1.1]TGU89399.1 DUF1488 domain-containing protein [Mesorhizobium sp. M00.F.Ca.ET.151.01.1.1]